MSNEGASITAMSDISDGTAFNNGHRQQRQTDRQTDRQREQEREAKVEMGRERDEVVKEGMRVLIETHG